MAGYADPFGASPTTSTGTGSGPPPGYDPAQWESWYLNNNPEAGWVRYLQNLGLYGLDPRSQFASRQYGRAQGMFNSAAAQNPNLGFYDWVKGSGLDLAGDYANQSPDTRGDFSDRTVNARARFMRAY